MSQNTQVLYLSYSFDKIYTKTKNIDTIEMFGLASPLAIQYMR